VRWSFGRRTSWLVLIFCLMATEVRDRPAIPSQRMWGFELERLKRQLDSLPTDLEKTSFLREYVGGLIDIGRPDGRATRLYQRVDFENFDNAAFYPWYRTHNLAAECGITTFFYIKLLQTFGFKAYQYSFGFNEQPYSQFIHSVVLVNIEFHGVRRLIIQDPYLDLTFRDRENGPIDFFDFLAALNERKFSRIVTETSSVTTSLEVPEPSLYLAFLEGNCRERFAAALRREDGSLSSRIPLVRSYATLMQSPCFNFEAAFVDAMRKHGINEPFLYSYTLRASDLVGSPDHREIQKRIDAVRQKAHDRPREER
jgi:hypothetical protein